MIPYLRSFCCGCSLKHGTLIVLIVPLICVALSPFVDTSAVGNHSFILKVAVYSMYMAVCISGLYAVYKQKRALLIPYLIFDFWMLYGSLSYCIFSFFADISITLIVLVSFPLYGYAFLVVLSYFHEMGLKKTPAPPTGA